MKRALVFALMLPLGQALAANKGGESQVSILPGGDAKSPISIEADRLDYFEREGKAIYEGHVVVVQGDTKLTCSKLTILMDKPGTAAAKPEPAKPEAGTASADASSRLKHMDCSGPVTVASKTQTATADNGSYDKGRSNVVLSGHVVLTDGRNVTKGDRLVYDLNTGQAAVQGGGQRVQGLFLPGGAETGGGAKKK
jgi:lipopolysaccharide export system protein LptA